MLLCPKCSTEISNEMILEYVREHDLDTMREMPTGQVLIAICNLISICKANLRREWELLTEECDLHSDDGELAMKLIGRVSENLDAIFSHAENLKKDKQAIEMVEELRQSLPKTKDIPF